MFILYLKWNWIPNEYFVENFCHLHQRELITTLFGLKNGNVFEYLQNKYETSLEYNFKKIEKLQIKFVSREELNGTSRKQVTLLSQQSKAKMQRKLLTENLPHEKE